MARCPFCIQEAKLSGEHLWSAWIGRILGRSGYAFRRRDAQGNVAKHWTGQGLDLTAKARTISPWTALWEPTPLSGFGKRFIHLIPNFCNTAISQGDSGDTFEGFSIGNAQTAAGSVWMSITGNNNVINVPQFSGSNYATFFPLTSTAQGNRITAPHLATGTDITFGASTSKNTLDCQGGGCTLTDSSGRNSGNKVIDPANGVWLPLGFYHNDSITSDPGTQTLLASGSVVTALYWWTNECPTKTSGSGTTGSFQLAFAMKLGRKPSPQAPCIKYNHTHHGICRS